MGLLDFLLEMFVGRSTENHRNMQKNNQARRNIDSYDRGYKDGYEDAYLDYDLEDLEEIERLEELEELEELEDLEDEFEDDEYDVDDY